MPTFIQYRFNDYRSLKAGEGRETARRLGRGQLKNRLHGARTGGFFVACVAWRFWLLSNKGGRGQRNREEIGAGATFIFLAASPLVLAHFAREFRGFAARAPGSTKPPCYAGYDCRGIATFPSPRHFPPGLPLVDFFLSCCFLAIFSPLPPLPNGEPVHWLR